ncbi:MAG: NUDIX domain-containing protein [Lentisphaeria bacterium]|nr:NUDIX domain-containing protein [Lentisphaeria bacterium]
MNGDVIEVVAAVIRRGGQVLLASRPADKPPAGWEFPGGKIEPGETPGEALTREIWEELGVEATPGAELETLVNGRIRLHFIAAAIPDSAVPSPREHQQVFWAELTPEVPEKLLPADHEFWKRLAKTDNFF